DRHQRAVELVLPERVGGVEAEEELGRLPRCRGEERGEERRLPAHLRRRGEFVEGEEARRGEAEGDEREEPRLEGEIDQLRPGADRSGGGERDAEDHRTGEEEAEVAGQRL